MELSPSPKDKRHKSTASLFNHSLNQVCQNLSICLQTTIPYVDAQPVSPKSGSWLGGVGFYHKGHLGYGGYVGVSVETFDFRDRFS
jgi:hypothetical protein